MKNHKASHLEQINDKKIAIYDPNHIICFIWTDSFLFLMKSPGIHLPLNAFIWMNRNVWFQLWVSAGSRLHRWVCTHNTSSTTTTPLTPLPDLHLPDEIWPFHVLNDLNQALADAEGGVLIEAPLTQMMCHINPLKPFVIPVWSDRNNNTICIALTHISVVILSNIMRHFTRMVQVAHFIVR